MTRPRTVGLYRKVLWLYPRSFREEYGDDMALMVADQLDNESTVRVCARLGLDLALTVPARRLEAHMNRPSSSVVTLVFVILAVAGLVAVLVGGLYAVPTLVGGVVALGFGALAVVSARRSRALTGAPVRSHWWRFLVGGAAALALLVIVTTITGELPDAGWAVAMTVLFAALASMVTGVVLGLARLSVGLGRSAAG
jgi:hypothetical protein